MKKRITLFTFLILLLALAANSLAQTPQYYNYNTTSGGNTFPFGQAAGKMVQWLVAPGEFNVPSSARSGYITSFYVMMAGTGGPATYTAFYILLGQTTLTSLPTGAFYTGQMDTVYKKASVTLSATIGTWLKFTLDHPFRYDSTKSLVIQIEQCGATGTLSGMNVAQTTLTGNRRSWSLTSTPCPWTYFMQGTTVLNCGADIMVPPASPPFYNYNTGTSVNTFPFGQSGGKEVQWLVLANEFNQPSPAPQGYITTLYFYMGSTATVRFTSLLIKLGKTSLTSLPAGIIYTGPMDTVYFKDSVTLSSVNNAWMMIPLTKLYAYDNTMSLVIDVSQCGASASTMYVRQTSLTPVRRTYINHSGNCVFVYSGQDGALINCGLNIINFTGIHHNGNNVPLAYSLGQNYPNPFNPTTKISFALPKAGDVELKVYDILGREVAVLINEFKAAGSYTIDFNASSISSGVYFYTLKSGNFTGTKKMLLIK
jgi:hypothetical protein